MAIRHRVAFFMAAFGTRLHLVLGLRLRCGGVWVYIPISKSVRRILSQMRSWSHEFRPSAGLRQFLVAVLYVILLSICLPAAYLLRFDFSLSSLETVNLLQCLFWVVPLKVFLLFQLGTLRSHLGFFGVVGLVRVATGLAIATAVLLAVRIVTQATVFAPPISVTLIDFVLSVMVVGGVRLLLRVARHYALEVGAGSDGDGSESKVDRVAIIGAGDAGTMLAQEILLKPRFRMKPIAYYDDDQSKWGIEIHGVRVVGKPELLAGAGHRKQRIDRVIIAIPSANVRRLRSLVEMLQAEGLPFQTIPSLDQLTKGHVHVTQVRPVEIEDLLGRDSIKLDTLDIRKLICGQVVMVTGAGGSIGSEICLQIAANSPSRLLLVDRSEVQLFQVEQALVDAGYGGLIQPLIADVTDRIRVNQILATHRPKLIFHAAAHKHVPLMEAQAGEAIKNNSIGTALLAELAQEHRVDRFVLISTDKAINPVNVMGASKRLAELCLQALHARNGGVTRFMAVRFGNVLGSSGSVIPQFKKQIAAGGPVRVTCPEITRYFMTIPEAVGLVLQCATIGRGGDILVLDMGKPVRIVDLARQLIQLSGFKPEQDIEIEFTGLRPGEKCFEELNYVGENYSPTAHPAIMRFTATPPSLEKVLANLKGLAEVLHARSEDELKTLLAQTLPDYHPRRSDGSGAAGTNGATRSAPNASTTCHYGKTLPGQMPVHAVVGENCPCAKARLAAIVGGKPQGPIPCKAAD